jgi:hypothetical protein
MNIYVSSGEIISIISRHGPDHYLVPVHINGSAIESLFIRFKYNVDGNLSAVNDETAVSRLLTANSVAQSSDYRKSEINITGQLKRKKVPNNKFMFSFVLSLMHMALIHHVGLRSLKFLFVSPKSAPCPFSVNSTFCQRASCKNHV